MKLYNVISWISAKVEVRNSPIEGKGMFAKEEIKKDETVIIWGGVVFTKEEVKAGKAKKHSTAAISEDLYLAAPKDAADSDDEYTNHSCDPNLWMKDEVTLISRRDIKVGEELTADYIFWEANEEWVMPRECNCDSPLCRKRINGRDWRLKELQVRYKDHFSPFINERIEKIK